MSTSDPNFDASALHVFDQFFGLPDPPSFQKYDEFGNPGGTGVDLGWGTEIALDVEWAHAMAPAANIQLVEGYSSSFDDLGIATRTAGTTLGANVVSMSFGANLEYFGDGAEEDYIDQTYYEPALAANPGLTLLASTGDGSAAFGPEYPSISPLVVGVGGTSLNATGNTWTGEYSWNAGGGGISNHYSAPSYQSVNITGYAERTNPDVSSDANLETGVSVYDPHDFGGWVVVGGTSVSSPTWAGLIGIADQGRVLAGGTSLGGPTQTLPGLYAGVDYFNNFHDITQDYNGEGNNGFPTLTGYDLDTGIGSPRADKLIPYLSFFDLGPAVVSSNPAAGQVVTGSTPTTFSLTFNEPIEMGSITASDFTVDGVPADSDSLSGDGLTITYTYNTSPVTTQGSQTMSLPADSVIGANDGLPNAGTFTSSFFYVINQLQVESTSPAVGSVLTVPVTDLVVTFNEAVNPYAISTSDFQLSQGSVVKAVPLTPESIDLTLSGVTQDGSLTLTVPAGVLFDMFGVPNLGFTGNYIVDIVSAPYPTPLQGQVPPGSLIYDPSVTGTIGFVGDTDSYTLPLDGDQQSLTIAAGGRCEPPGCDLRHGPRRQRHRPEDRPRRPGETRRVPDHSDHDLGHVHNHGRRCQWHDGRLHDAGHLERGLQAGHRQHQHDRYGLQLGRRVRGPGHHPLRRPRRRGRDPGRYSGRHVRAECLRLLGPGRRTDIHRHHRYRHADSDGYRR